MYLDEHLRQNFGTSAFRLASRSRVDVSFDTVREYGKELKLNRVAEAAYAPSGRYLLATDITYDLFLSLYDVNASNVMAMRISSKLDRASLSRMRSFARNPERNIEVRAIGMIDDDKTLVNELDRVHDAVGGRLVEVDLFGKEVRHIAFDTKLGMALNLLVGNRVYKQYELVNALAFDDFTPMRSKLNFV